MIYLEVVFHSPKIVHVSDIRMKENNACVTEEINMVYSRNIFKLLFSELFQMSLDFSPKLCGKSRREPKSPEHR